MNITSYTDNQIFTNNQINALCDLLFSKLVDAFPPVGLDVDNDYVYQGIILSGKAAEITQNPKVEAANNIIFQTDNAALYKFVQDNFKTIFNCSGIVFQERTLFYPFDYYFEVWYDPTALHPVVSNNVYMQDIDFIPSIML